MRSLPTDRFLAIAVLLGLLHPVQGQTTARVSVATGGAQGNAATSQGYAGISADARYFAFYSDATNLVPGDGNGFRDAFVRDRVTGTTELVSVSSGGAQGDAASGSADAGIAISRDGRYVAFYSDATNLVPGDANGVTDAFVRDRTTGVTERVSLSSTGAEGNASSRFDSIAISDDGRFLAFASDATNLVPGDANGAQDVFLRDRQSGTTELVSVSTAGGAGNARSGWYGLSMSADGRYVAFDSDATDLVASDPNFGSDVFVRDRLSATTEGISDAFSLFNYAPAITPDGRFVAYDGVDAVSGSNEEVRVYDRATHSASAYSVPGFDAEQAAISDDGRHVAFGFVGHAPGSLLQVLVLDLATHAVTQVSESSSGASGNGNSYASVLTGDARFAAFASRATNLVPDDTNGLADVFVRDLQGGTGFTSLCDPGAGGVRACPCGNPPGGLGAGCDNSSTTGGAVLSAAGGTYLSSDSLVFTTHGEKPTATSVLLQGTTFVSGGVTYGQGVRCLGGTLKRLFTKTAASGSIRAPDFAAGDPQVSARSAAKGDPIGAGESRWYLVFYRDPTVLGGCPATSTFDCTQTGRVDWTP